MWSFHSLLAMLHVVDLLSEDLTEKLRKFNIKSKCKNLFQPYQNIIIEEWLPKLKNRYGIRQYITNRPVKFGQKLWVLAEILTRYTYDFLIYTEKSNETHNYGLGYLVVIKLMGPLLNQGYHLLLDKFYTSVKLLND